MTISVTIIAWALALGTMLPMLVFSIECLVGLRPAPEPVHFAGPLPPFTVLIPAHDEATGIAAVLASVKAQLRPCDRVLVIADNCTDATALVARQAGAEVAERTDRDHIGKTHALAFGRRLLRRYRPEIVVILDADCEPGDGALIALAMAAAQHHAAVQGRYLLSPPDDAPPLVRISSFAFLIKNLVRQRGLQRLGGIALLQGCGMAFPWRIFGAAPLDRPSLVEDLKLGIDLAMMGCDVRFEETACFHSPASSQGATVSQRTRWEHGTLATAFRYVPRLLFAGIIRRTALLALAADLMVPPLSLLAATAGAATAALLIATLITGDAMPLGALLLAESAFATALTATWFVCGRTMLPARALLRLPRYLFWKLPIYGRVLTRPQRGWVRTSRLP